MKICCQNTKFSARKRKTPHSFFLTLYLDYLQPGWLAVGGGTFVGVAVDHTMRYKSLCTFNWGDAHSYCSWVERKTLGERSPSTLVGRCPGLRFRGWSLVDTFWPPVSGRLAAASRWPRGYSCSRLTGEGGASETKFIKFVQFSWIVIIL